MPEPPCFHNLHISAPGIITSYRLRFRTIFRNSVTENNRGACLSINEGSVMLLTEFHMGASIYDVRVGGRGETVLSMQTSCKILLIYHKRKPLGTTYDSVRRPIIKISVESVRGTRMKSEERAREGGALIIISTKCPRIHSAFKNGIIKS